MATMFAVTSVLLSYVFDWTRLERFLTLSPCRFSVTNSVVFAQYIIHAFDMTSTPFMIRLLSIGVCTFAVGGLTSLFVTPNKLIHHMPSLWNFDQMVFKSSQHLDVRQGCEPSIVSMRDCSTTWSLKRSSISISGIFVLAGWIPIQHPPSNFTDIWKGSNTGPNSLALGVFYLPFAIITVQLIVTQPSLRSISPMLVTQMRTISSPKSGVKTRHARSAIQE